MCSVQDHIRHECRVMATIKVARLEPRPAAALKANEKQLVQLPYTTHLPGIELSNTVELDKATEQFDECFWSMFWPVCCGLFASIVLAMTCDTASIP